MKTIACWVVFGVFSLSMIAVGIWLSRLAKSRHPGYRNIDFWMAGRLTPGWQLGISLTSGWLMLGWIGFGMSQIYAYGSTGLWLLQIPWFILCILIVILSPFYRKVASLSLPQALGMRFGAPLRYLTAFFSVFIFLSWAGAELVMVKTLIAPQVGLADHANLFLAIFILPVIIYTVTGGFRAIIATDVIQFFFMALFMIILGVWAYQEASAATGGRIMETLKSVTPPRADAGEIFNIGFLGWIFPLCMLIGYLPGWLVEQDLALRMQAAPTTREARKGAVVGFVLITVFVILIPAAVAFLALAAFPPGSPRGELVGGDFTGIILAFISQMPDWLAVLMFLGAVTCQMSTVDTFANVSALPLAYDLIGPTMMHKSSSGKIGMVSKAATIGILVCSFLYATIASKLGDVYYLSSGILSASVAVPALAVFWKRATFPAVLCGSIAGALATLISYRWEYYVLQAADPNATNYYADILPKFLLGGYGYFYICAGVLVSAIVIAAVSLITPKPSGECLRSVDILPKEGSSPIEAVSEQSAS